MHAYGRSRGIPPHIPNHSNTRTLATLPAEEKHLEPIEYKAGWAPEGVRTFGRRGKSLAPAGYLIPVRSGQILVSLPISYPSSH
jgi:hypothetical protein